ncbi:uncharacterized protein LOC131254927 [Magnolia sinica]|uniref:uncharacterized protein LOC131254927 n=1 Tax=Magnolia sinica TaxID=86752 RepID=UPI00265B3712|nr:uncharacterized protein LOC131254927 [Magnolia sinica]
MGIPVPTQPRCSSQVVIWRKPLSGWVKLNIDVLARGNLGAAGGGGVGRGERSKFLFGFHTGYGVASNTRAELWTIHDGLQHCLHLGYPNILVEINSLLVVNFLSGDAVPGWKWKVWIDRINNLSKCRNVNFVHTFREGNRPVNALAKLGNECQRSSLFLDHFDLPLMVRGLLFLDRLALGSVRRGT